MPLMKAAATEGIPGEMTGEAAKAGIAFVTSLLAHSVGGPISAMLGLGGALAQLGWRVSLHHVKPADSADYVGPVDRIEFCDYRCLLPDSLALSSSMKRSFLGREQQPSIYHVNGLWTMPGHYAAVAARRRSVPLVWSPRNMLEPKYLDFHAWRKRAFAALFSKADLSSATCLHALTAQELADIRLYGLTNPIALVPNGVNLPAPASPQEIAGLAAKHPDLKDRKWFLFLGRIHPNKGLDHLIRAWAELAGRFEEWQLVLAGPGEQAHRQRFEGLSRDLNVSDRVTFVGLLTGARKDAALQHAEFFVLPSISEGLSNAALEGLAAGAAALMTPGCSFDAAVKCGAALLAEPNAKAWVAGVERMIAMPEQQRREMGRLGRRLIESGYTWQQVAGKMDALYRWMLGEAPAPEFVEE
jgi:poly(glycerol-phosphate) alpha-glucosyltransferase